SWPSSFPKTKRRPRKERRFLSEANCTTVPWVRKQGRRQHCPEGRVSISKFSSEINSLAELDRIRTLYTAFRTVGANALALSINLGIPILEARKSVSMRSICETAGIPSSTARLLVPLAKHQVGIKAAQEECPQLSIRAARRPIASGRGSTPQTSEPT